MKAFEYKGIWWLPEKPDNKIAGILKFDPVEIPKLELFGAFGDKQSFPMINQIILGITDKAKAITLYDCDEFTRPSSSSSLHTIEQTYSSFTAMIVFTGCLFQSSEDIRFDKVGVNFANLEEWSRFSGEHWRIGFDENSNITVNPYPFETTAHINNLRISLQHNFSHEFHLQRLSTTQITNIVIESDKQLHFEFYRENLIHKIQIFLSLGMGTATYPISITGITDQSEAFVDISYPLIPDLITNAKQVSNFKMLFTLEDISSDSERYLRNWLEKSNKLEPIYNLYAATVYHSSSMYLEQEFLTLTQAIEAYHRRVNDRTYMETNNYEKIRDHLLSQIPKDTERNLKDRIENSIRNANRLTLRDRLTDFWKEQQQIVRQVFPNRKSFDSFVNQTVKTRNFLTLYDENTQPDAKTDMETLMKLIPKLRLIIEVYLLSAIGLSTAPIQRIVEKNRLRRYT